MWPVIIRELREEARRSGHYRLRLVAGGLVFAALALMWLSGEIGDGEGATAFSVVHETFYWTLWFLVPVMTADCISRERREGTLGLLFLTDLSARGIVSGKCFVHFLRALALVVAVVPAMTVCFLIGGIGWREAVLSVMTNVSAIYLGIAAGVLGSVGATRWGVAVSRALGWTVVMMLGYSAFLYFFTTIVFGDFVMLPSIGLLIQFLMHVGGNHDAIFSEVFRMSFPGGHAAVWGVYASGLLIAMLIFRSVEAVAARHLRRRWQDRPRTEAQQRRWNFFLSPKYLTGIFRSKLNRLMERNPVGWLQYRSAGARIGRLMVLLISILACSIMFGWEDQEAVLTGFGVLCSLILLALLIEACGSFLRERETGAMELLLVTPLNEAAIVNGRLRALWTGYALSGALAVVTGWTWGSLFWKSGWHSHPILPRLSELVLWYFPACFIVIPLVGLCQSLRRRWILSALAFTMLWTLVLPFFTAMCVSWMQQAWGSFAEWTIPLWWIALGGCFAGWLYSQLRYSEAKLVALMVVVLFVPGLFLSDNGRRHRRSDSREPWLAFAIVQVVIGGRSFKTLHRDLEERRFSQPEG